MNKQKGFTLIELLVVISIIVLLAAMLLPVLSRIREMANKSVCSSNIRQHALALTAYADENNGNLPRLYGGGWLWDMDRRLVNELLKNIGLEGKGATSSNQPDIPAPDVFYCPSNKTHKFSRQECWDYHHPSGEMATYRVLGYFFILDTRNGRGQIQPPEDNKRWLTTLNLKHPADAEFVIDVIMSDQQTFQAPEYPYGNFARIEAGSGMGLYTGYYDTSSHLKSDKEPTGGNIGFADCHVAWRDFKEGNTLIMKERYGSSSPVFWW